MTVAGARRLHLRAGEASDGDDPVHVSPTVAGWDRAGLRVVTLAPGAERELATEDTEVAVIPLEGALRVHCDDQSFELNGRPDVFSAVSDFAYLPVGSVAVLSSDRGSRVALASAVAERRLAPAYCPAEQVPIEVRGAGPATRQVTNLLTPESFPADRLLVVEVLTPAGNWSSYPPHKHDEEGPCEAALEEIYYFEVARGVGNRGGPPREVGAGTAYHHVYGADGSFEFCGPVAHGDVVLVPAGYHGPSQAPPGYDLYYLNVLAGSGPRRTMACTDDPAHGWVRTAWEADEPDPRVPMTGAPSAAVRR